MDVFVCLAAHGCDLVSRNELLDVVWSESTGSDEQLTRAIGELRRVLHDDPGDPKYVETVPKRGYRLIAEVGLPDDNRLENKVDNSGSATQYSGRKSFQIVIAVLLISFTTLVVLDVGNVRNSLLGGSGPAPISSIAVLPLSNLSGDPEQEYFTDGMTEALTAQLGQISGLKVISRTSAMQYKAADKLMPEIARELGADALVEGSVLRAGDEVRITLQLIHGPTDRHLWSKSFRRDLRDILALQREVAHAIADHIQTTLIPSLRDKLPPVSDNTQVERQDPVAYEAYLKGRYHFNSFGEAAFRTAIRYYEDAISTDPNFALAYAALAEACMQPSIIFNRILSLDDCEAAATRAIEFDDELAEAHATLGFARVLRWDWEAAESRFERALDLNPNSVMAHQWYSAALRPLLRSDEALQEIRRAEELDPLNLFVKTMVGWPLLDQRRYDEALAQFDDVLAMNPDFTLAHYNKGLVYILLRMPEEVLGSARRVAEISGENGFESRILTAAAYAVRGDEDKTLDLLGAVERDYGDIAIGWYATIYITLGKVEEAFLSLETAYEIRSPDLPISMSEPFFDDIRDHPRFQALRHKMGLP